jgi:hypothetical protein
MQPSATISSALTAARSHCCSTAALAPALTHSGSAAAGHGRGGPLLLAADQGADRVAARAIGAVFGRVAEKNGLRSCGRGGGAAFVVRVARAGWGGAAFVWAPSANPLAQPTNHHVTGLGPSALGNPLDSPYAIWTSGASWAGPGPPASGLWALVSGGSYGCGCGWWLVVVVGTVSRI